MRKPNFLNTDRFDQIDWAKEIDNEKPVSRDAQFKRMSEAVQVWVLAKEHFKPSVETLKEEHHKANLMRMHQYFYAKFLYHHTLAYEKDIDLAKKDSEDAIDQLRKILGKKLVRSKVPLNTIEPIRKVLLENIRKNAAERKKEDGGYKEAKKLFETQGLKCVKPKGLMKEGDRDSVCTVYDGVRYHLYLLKRREDRTEEKAKYEADDHKQMIEWYHPLVKEVYQKIKQLPNIGEVWAMAGGGMQHQVFFGNDTGYLAILYLDFKNKKTKPKYKNYILQVNRSKNDKLFKDFKVEHIKVRTSEEVYGKDEELMDELSH